MLRNLVTNSKNASAITLAILPVIAYVRIFTEFRLGNKMQRPEHQRKSSERRGPDRRDDERREASRRQVSRRTANAEIEHDLRANSDRRDDERREEQDIRRTGSRRDHADRRNE